MPGFNLIEDEYGRPKELILTDENGLERNITQELIQQGGFVNQAQNFQPSGAMGGNPGSPEAVEAMQEQAGLLQQENQESRLAAEQEQQQQQSFDQAQSQQMQLDQMTEDAAGSLPVVGGAARQGARAFNQVGRTAGRINRTVAGAGVDFLEGLVNTVGDVAGAVSGNEFGDFDGLSKISGVDKYRQNGLEKATRSMIGFYLGFKTLAGKPFTQAATGKTGVGLLRNAPGFKGALAAGGLKAKLGAAALDTTASAATTFLADREEQESNLFNLFEKTPFLKHIPFSDVLSIDEDDGAVERRIKNAFADVYTGFALDFAEPLLDMTRGIKRAKQFDDVLEANTYLTKEVIPQAEAKATQLEIAFDKEVSDMSIDDLLKDIPDATSSEQKFFLNLKIDEIEQVKRGFKDYDETLSPLERTLKDEQSGVRQLTEHLRQQADAIDNTVIDDLVDETAQRTVRTKPELLQTAAVNKARREAQERAVKSHQARYSESKRIAEATKTAYKTGRDPRELINLKHILPEQIHPVMKDVMKLMDKDFDKFRINFGDLQDSVVDFLQETKAVLSPEDFDNLMLTLSDNVNDLPKAMVAYRTVMATLSHDISQSAMKVLTLDLDPSTESAILAETLEEIDKLTEYMKLTKFVQMRNAQATATGNIDVIPLQLAQGKKTKGFPTEKEYQKFIRENCNL